MSTAKRVLVNTVFLYAKIGITSVCLLLSTRYVLQALGVTDYGIYNLIASTVVMLSFLNESMTAATQRFISYAEGTGDTQRTKNIFNSSFLIHIILAQIVTLVFVAMHHVFFGGHLQIPSDRIHAAVVVYYLMVASTSLNIMTVPYNAILVAHENMLYYSIVGSISGVLKLCISIVLLHVSVDRLILYGALMFGVTLVEWTISRAYCHTHYEECKIALKKYADKQIAKEMFSFAGWQLLYSASSILSIQGVSLILNSFFGAIMNAAQGVAKQVCGILMTLSGTMMHALNPVIVKKAGGHDQNSLVQVTISGSKLSFLLVIIIALPVLFELPFLLKVWLTEVPDFALPFCVFEVIQQIIASFTVALVTMIGGVGDIKSFQIFSAVTYILRLPIIYMAFLLGAEPMYAYYVATTAVIVLCIGRVYFAHRKCELPVAPFLCGVVAPCVAVSLLVITSLFLETSLIPSTWLRVLVTIIISTLEIGVMSYWFVFDKMEKQLVHHALIFAKEKFFSRAR